MFNHRLSPFRLGRSFSKPEFCCLELFVDTAWLPADKCNPTAAQVQGIQAALDYALAQANALYAYPVNSRTVLDSIPTQISNCTAGTTAGNEINPTYLNPGEHLLRVWSAPVALDNASQSASHDTKISQSACARQGPNSALAHLSRQEL